MKVDKHTGKIADIRDYIPGGSTVLRRRVPDNLSSMEIIIDDGAEPYKPRALLKVFGALADYLWNLTSGLIPQVNNELFCRANFYSDLECNLVYYVIEAPGSNVPAYAVTQTEDGAVLITFGGIRRQTPDGPLLPMDLHDIGRWDSWLQERNIR